LDSGKQDVAANNTLGEKKSTGGGGVYLSLWTCFGEKRRAVGKYASLAAGIGGAIRGKTGFVISKVEGGTLEVGQGKLSITRVTRRSGLEIPGRARMIDVPGFGFDG